jgi:hypothetical protein
MFDKIIIDKNSFFILLKIHRLFQRFVNKELSLNQDFGQNLNKSIINRLYSSRNLIDLILNKILDSHKLVQAFFDIKLFDKTSCKDLPQKL